MSPVTSDHSLVEYLGAPPPEVTPEDIAAVERLLLKAFPDDSSAHRTVRHELSEILFAAPSGPVTA